MWGPLLPDLSRSYDTPIEIPSDGRIDFDWSEIGPVLAELMANYRTWSDNRTGDRKKKFNRTGALHRSNQLLVRENDQRSRTIPTCRVETSCSLPRRSASGPPPPPGRGRVGRDRDAPELRSSQRFPSPASPPTGNRRRISPTPTSWRDLRTDGGDRSGRCWRHGSSARARGRTRRRTTEKPLMATRRTPLERNALRRRGRKNRSYVEPRAREREQSTDIDCRFWFHTEKTRKS